MEHSFKINNFDLLRIFAAIQVLILHSVHHLHITKLYWISLLSYFPGVPIFYTISGYLISASYERNNSLNIFFRNRFLRIYPGLWVCLFLTILVASLFGFNFFNRSTPVWLISQMAGFIYTPKFLKNFGFGSYNGSLWTILVELQFYILLPFIYLLIGKGNNRTFILFLLFFLFVSIAVLAKFFLPNLGLIYDGHESNFEKALRYSFFPHFYMFFAGVIMQHLKFYKLNWIYGKGLHWIAIYIVVETLISYSHIPTLSILSLLLLSVSVVALAYSFPELSHKILNGNDISYGVYIYHGLILNILVSFKVFHQPFLLLCVLLIALFFGYFSWVFVEKPFLRRKNETINTKLKKENITHNSSELISSKHSVPSSE